MPATPSTTGFGYLVISVSVAKWPAARAVSLMPKRAHSIESTRVRFSTAARAAEECAMPGSPWWGESVTLTILPPRASGIIALVATAWVISHVPSTFRRMHRAEALRRDVLGRRHVLAAGVVDEQVDLAVALEHGVDERLDLVLLADVAGARLDAAAVGLRGGLVERLLAPAADDHLGAERRQLERGGAAQARAASADDRHLPVEQTGLEELRGHRRASVTPARC